MMGTVPKKNATVQMGISDTTELHDLLYAISEEYPMVISANLTQNTYNVLEYWKNIAKWAKPFGVFDELVQAGASMADPHHRRKFLDVLSRESLLQAYAEGKRKVELDFLQRKDDGGYRWFKMTAIFLAGEEGGDVREITLAHPIEEEKEQELENIRLRTLMEMAMFADYDYISVVNLKTGLYETIAANPSGKKMILPKGDYDKTLMFLRDTLAPEAEREEFFKNLRLSNVVAKLKENGGRFSYRYRLNGIPERRWRESAFHICPSNEDEIVHTVRDVQDEVTAEQAKRTEEILRRNQERQQLLTGLGFDVIVDVDVVTGRAEVLGEVKALLNRDINCENFPWGEINDGMIHPDDVEAVKKAIDLPRNVTSFSLDFRYRHGDGYYFWCRGRAVALCDDAGKAYRCILKITDIEDQKRSEQKLLYEAQRDSLTGLYNSATTETLVNDFLAGEGKGGRHGLLVIDADDFKRVNDRWGHKTGDSVLKSFAGMLASSVRSTDIVGRVGGDEFAVLLKNTETREAVLDSARKILQRIRPVPVNGTGEFYTPTCSVGVALYPDNGATYSDIFRLADAAMYSVKERGKNDVGLYGNPPGA